MAFLNDCYSSLTQAQIFSPLIKLRREIIELTITLKMSKQDISCCIINDPECN